MSNQINLNITIAEAVAVEVFPDDNLMPIAMAEILGVDFRSDDEAEFLQAVLSLQQEIEDVLMSDNTEDFLLPTQDDIAPIFAFYEKLEDLKAFRFGKRTLERMERRIRGTGVVVIPKITETDKASNPAYRPCPDCGRHFMKGYLGFHIGTPICIKVATAHNLRPTTSQQKKVSTKIYNACLDLEDLFKRVVAYKKHIEPELEAEPMEEEKDPKRHIKLYWNTDNTTFYEYNGDVEWNFDDREVNKAFELAKEWGKSQEGLASICLEETYSDSSESEILCKYDIEAEPMDEEKEVRGFCVQCEQEGKFIGKVGDEWTCLDCLEREDEDYAYVVRTWVYDATTDAIEYFGLYEGADWRKSWETESEAELAFNSAIDGGEFIAVELIQIDPSSEERETIMNGWKGSIKRGEEIIIQKWECNLTDFLEEGGETDKEAD